MMKQTAEMNVNVNGHRGCRMLEKDKSLDWKQVMVDKDPYCELLFCNSVFELICVLSKLEISVVGIFIMDVWLGFVY
ncbi:hypothetical protein Hanom_Chr06g00478621 [Helianthus anomalus]